VVVEAEAVVGKPGPGPGGGAVVVVTAVGDFASNLGDL